MPEERIIVFDTTLRDGEQAPGCTMTPVEKLKMAHQLEMLGVDVIEAGFPAAAPEESEAVERIAKEIRSTEIAAIARAKTGDIDRAWEALQKAADPRIHIILPASDILLEHQLRRNRQEVLEIAWRSVTYARKRTANVEFSAMDATRADRDFLCSLLATVIDAGAKVVNIADTVGYAVPAQFGELAHFLMEHLRHLGSPVLSVHCHDDLGLAVANTLAAVEHGARQVKCTVNGIGERAGNAALEEVVMALRTRSDHFRVRTGIRTEHLYDTSRLLTEITGITVQPNKAVVGANAFAHEAGIHQDGMLKDPRTYEIIAPQSVGVTASHLILGKHSGRNAVRFYLQKQGGLVDDRRLNDTMSRIKQASSHDLSYPRLSLSDTISVPAGPTASPRAVLKAARQCIAGSRSGRQATVLRRKGMVLHRYRRPVGVSTGRGRTGRLRPRSQSTGIPGREAEGCASTSWQ